MQNNSKVKKLILCSLRQETIRWPSDITFGPQKLSVTKQNTSNHMICLKKNHSKLIPSITISSTWISVYIYIRKKVRVLDFTRILTFTNSFSVQYGVLTAPQPTQL